MTTIAPAATRDVVIRFTPGSFGAIQGGITFASNGGAVSVNATAVVGVQLSGGVTALDGAGLPFVTVELRGSATASTVTDAQGQYNFFVSPNNAYTVTPVNSGFTFTPINRSVPTTTNNVGGLDFQASCSSTAVMQTPANGSTLPGATVTFTWSTGCQATAYWLSVGTGPGGLDLYHQSQGTSLSGTVGGLPTTGQPLYVRLWSLIGGAWQFNDYNYTAFGGAVCAPAAKADLQTPAPGATLAGATTNFTWSKGCQVGAYWLSVGTTPGGTDLYHQSQGSSLSGTVGGLPTTGQPLYVRLWSFIAGAWQFNDYTYLAFGAVACTPAAKADLLTPAPGSTLAGGTVTFTWSMGCQATAYWLSVGTTPGGTDLYHQSQGSNLSGTVGGLPTTGQPVYVRLWSLIGGVWQFNDYTYTACSSGCGGGGGSPKAQMQTPAPGTVLAGATVTFTWSAGSGVLEYWLDIGTTPGGSDLLHQSQGTNLLGTVGGLPTTGQPVYVRLWSRFTGVWQQFNDYTYTACSSGCGGGDPKAQMLTPAPGTVLAGATVTFTWSTGGGATEYFLDVGTKPGGFDFNCIACNLYHQSQGTNLSATVQGLPTTGQPVYVRLWSLISGVWQFNDYVYTAAGT